MPSPAEAHNLSPYSVSEISSAVKRTVEDAYGYVRVRGEITNHKGRHASGHCYFDLKDDKATLSAVCWRGSFEKLSVGIENGLEVIASGKLTTYPGRSSYQLIVESVELAGEGALMALLEKRKKMLLAEGLFDPEKKRPLPYLPRTIGVITSPTGAVIRDILHRLGDRFPVHVLVWPVRVQGEGAAAEIARAIEGFANMPAHLPRPDLLIVARGGGSLEDLWAFNEEIVVRAAAASPIPLISAVGHETDTTLIDFASDRRAPTPTAAAEMAVPVLAELRLALRERGLRMQRGLTGKLAHDRRHVEGLARGLPKPDQLIAAQVQRLDHLADKLRGGLVQLVSHQKARLDRDARALSARRLQPRLTHHRETLGRLAGRLTPARLDRFRIRLEGPARLLETLAYKNVLKRGYALVLSDGHPVTSASAFPNKGATLRFGDESQLDVMRAGDAPRPAPRSKKAPAAPSTQTKLF